MQPARHPRAPQHGVFGRAGLAGQLFDGHHAAGPQRGEPEGGAEEAKEEGYFFARGGGPYGPVAAREAPAEEEQE